MASAQVIDLESYRSRRRPHVVAAPSPREAAAFQLVPFFWVPVWFWFPYAPGGN